MQNIKRNSQKRYQIIIVVSILFIFVLFTVSYMDLNYQSEKFFLQAGEDFGKYVGIDIHADQDEMNEQFCRLILNGTTNSYLQDIQNGYKKPVLETKRNDYQELRDICKEILKERKHRKLR